MSNAGQFLSAAVGGAIGFVLGGPAGALYGVQAGLLAGSIISPTQLPGIQGPRLDDVERLAADPGEPIAIVWGTAAVSGFRMYLSDTLTEVSSTEEVGGKGPPSQEVTSYEYFQTLALGLCEGPIGGVLRIWENGELVYDIRDQQEGESDEDYQARVEMSGAYAETFTLYLGTEDQEPDPTLESELGEGNVPAYRGIAYIVFPDRALKPEQALRHPAFKVEVTSAPAVVGTVLVAVGSPANSELKGLARSLDGGESWETQEVTAGVAWAGVAYSPTLKRFCAIRPGFSAVSDDGGVTWTEHALPTAKNLSELIWSPGLEAFVAIAEGVTDSVSLKSPDGETWESGSGFNNAAAGTPLVDVPKLGSVFGLTANLAVTRSSNGLVWSYTTGLTGGGRDIAWSPDLEIMLVMSNGTVYSSFDGEDFTQRTTIAGGSPSAAWSEELGLWAVVSEAEVKSSANGITWSAAATLPLALSGLKGFIWSSYWSRFIVVSSLGTTGIGYRSSDSEEWTAISVPTNVQWRAIAEGDFASEAEAEGVSLADIAASICERAGLTSGEYDVSALADKVLGYAVGRNAPARSILDPIRMIGQFDYVESNGRVVFRVRGASPVATLNGEQLGVHEAGGQVPPPITTNKLQDFELPRQIRLKYFSYARDYERGEQLSSARIGTIGVNDVSVEVPVVLDDSHAATVAEVLFREAWASRYSHEFWLGPDYHALEPADPLIVPVDGRAYRVRIASIDDSALMIRKVRALRDDDGAYTSVAIATTPLRSPPQIALLGETEFVLLDLPALRDQDDDAGVYAAFWRSGTGQTWNGARLHRSTDSGATWAEVSTVSNQAIVGTLVSAPSSGDGYTWDDEQYIDVDIVTDDATLSSRTDSAVLSGANLLAIGEHGRWHLVQFATAELIGDRRYRLSRLLLGRRGTEHLIGTEQPGDRVVLLSGPGIVRVPLQTAQIGAEVIYRAVTAGAAFASASNEPFTGSGQALETFSPAHASIERDESGNITVSWIRRDRLSQTLRNGVPVPNSESSEAYEVDVLDGPGGSVLRSITGLSTPEAEYSATDQTTDFGSPQSSVTLRIYQLSATVGRGQYLEVTG